MNDKSQVKEETIHATDRDDLNGMMRERGFRVIRIEEIKDSPANIDIFKKKLSKKSLTLFCRQLSTMLTAGIPMVKCFEVLEAQTDDKLLKERLVSLQNDVLSGSSLSMAMSKFPNDFPDMLAEMVRVGEVTGDLNGVLLRMAEQYEKDGKVASKVKGALTYPLVVVFVAIAACVFMLIKVVPSFVDIFDSLNTDLPLATQILLDVSNFLTEKWYIALLLVPVIVILLIFLFRTKSVKYTVDKLKVTMKGISGPLQKLAASRFARTLYTLITSGVPIVQALGYTKRNVQNTYMEEHIDKMIVGVRQGKAMSSMMAESNAFPKILVSMLAVGESSGDLEGMLKKSAEYFDDEASAAVEQLTTIIEPIMIVIVGLLIGALVISLYAPMFGAISAIQGSV